MTAHKCPECGGRMVATRLDESPIEVPDEAAFGEGGARGPIAAVELEDEITTDATTLVCVGCGAIQSDRDPED